MIRIIIYQNEQNEYTGFRMEGHAGYAEHGQDIVCAAVSVLVINTINAVESFTADQFQHAVHEEKDVVCFEIVSTPVSDSAQLLLRSLVLGLEGIRSEYGKKYLKIRTLKQHDR
ncbi:MAG: ribosomal-processing cysteine protease Prp [Lachnospiraceae bacterium]|nr:ribosomal-processing cysteine protease Prp [Lachnospiraceae bacterium]